MKIPSLRGVLPSRASICIPMKTGTTKGLHYGIHSMAKIQSIDRDCWDIVHWFARVDLLYSHTAIEGRHGDGL